MNGNTFFSVFGFGIVWRRRLRSAFSETVWLIIFKIDLTAFAMGKCSQKALSLNYVIYISWWFLYRNTIDGLHLWRALSLSLPLSLDPPPQSVLSRYKWRWSAHITSRARSLKLNYRKSFGDTINSHKPDNNNTDNSSIYRNSQNKLA